MNRQSRRQLAKELRSQIAKGAVDLAQPPRTTLSVGYVFNRTVYEKWAFSLMRLIARSADRLQIRPLGVQCGPLLSRGRNLVLENFLQTEDEYLLFTDTDMVFTAEDVALLFESDAAIAGALYFSAAPGVDPFPVALREDPNEPGTYRPIEVPSEEGEFLEWSQADPFPVDSVGMGLTLIRRDVIEALAPIKRLWPFAETDEDHGYGEDLTFCMRAKEKGFETILVPRARAGHIKEYIY